MFYALQNIGWERMKLSIVILEITLWFKSFVGNINSMEVHVFMLNQI
jgi:hypothetical protein